jgi:phosphoribosyl-AMP cyclohydrolase
MDRYCTGRLHIPIVSGFAGEIPMHLGIRQASQNQNCKRVGNKVEIETGFHIYTLMKGRQMQERAKMSHEELEEGTELALDFGKLQKVAACGQALVPVAVQDTGSGELLIVAYANKQALDFTLENGVAAFWSSSRNELWVKGATSGDFLDVIDVRVNCEQNSLLYRVTMRGQGACHTKSDGAARPGCYYRKIGKDGLEFA